VCQPLTIYVTNFAAVVKETWLIFFDVASFFYRLTVGGDIVA